MASSAPCESFSGGFVDGRVWIGEPLTWGGREGAEKAQSPRSRLSGMGTRSSNDRRARLRGRNRVQQGVTKARGGSQSLEQANGRAAISRAVRLKQRWGRKQ